MTESPELIYYERVYGPFVHMSQGEKAIWIRWLAAGGTVYAPFTYDIRVGDGVTMPPSSSPFDKRAALALTRKRIDAQSATTNLVTIYEIKPRAGLGAVGQLIGYKNLYRQTYGDHLIISLYLVTDVLQPDMTSILFDNNIAYAEVGY